MPRRSTTTPSLKLPDHPPLYPSPNITRTTRLDIKTAEETFDQLYEEALSEAFASRLDALFDGSFDKAFETHFNGVYNTIIKRNFDYVFDRITERKSRMRGGDQGPSSSSTSGVLGEVEYTNKTPPKALKKDYQPHDIIRRKIRYGISRDIRKEVLFRVREAVKKDLEPEVRKAITREAFCDLLQESKSKNNQKQYGMPCTRLSPREPQSMMCTDNQTVMARPTNRPQPKPKDQDVIARPTIIPQPKSKDQDVVARPTTKLPVPKGQQSKPKDDQNSTSGTPQLPAKGHHSKFSEDLD